MATEVKLPKIGFSMESGAVEEWFVADGETVAEGQTLYSLEAEKAITEVESPAAGVLRIKVGTGEEYPVGTVIAEIE